MGQVPGCMYIIDRVKNPMCSWNKRENVLLSEFCSFFVQNWKDNILVVHVDGANVDTMNSKWTSLLWLFILFNWIETFSSLRNKAHSYNKTAWQWNMNLSLKVKLLQILLT